MLFLLLLCVLPSSVCAQPFMMDKDDPLLRGLVNWWVATPRQMGGTIWYPRVGQDRGTLVNMTLASTTSGWQSSSRRGASGEMRFDGTDDQVTTGATTLVANLPAFTVCLWFRSTLASGQQLYTENVGGWPDMMLAIAYPSSNINFNNYNNDGTGIETTGVPAVALTAGLWQHLCAVQRSKSSGEVWSNAVRAGTSTGTVGAVAPTQRALGSTPQGSNRFVGSLDDIRVYNRALSPSEIKQLFMQSLQSNPVGPSMVFQTTIQLLNKGLLPFFTQP